MCTPKPHPPCLTAMDLINGFMMHGLDDWECFRHGAHLDAPTWFVHGGQAFSANTWRGIMLWLGPLLTKCTPNMDLVDYRWGNMMAHKSHHDELGTECLLVNPIKRWLPTQHVFKLQPHGSTQHKASCPRRGYMMVKVGGFEDNDQTFLLHRLLCHMYRGTCPAHLVSPVAGHLCHHKLCLCPWHLAWMEQWENVQGGVDHAHQVDYMPVVNHM